MPPDSEAALAVLETDILAGDVSPQTHQVLLKQLNDPKVTQRKFDDPNRVPIMAPSPGLLWDHRSFPRR